MEQLAKEDICLAFSGGVDSSLLLKTAADAAAIREERCTPLRLTAACILPATWRLPGAWQGSWEESMSYYRG